MAARWSENDLAKLKNTKRVAGKMVGLSTNAMTVAILRFLETQGVEASRTNTVGIFDIKKAADLLAGKKLGSSKEVEELLRGCYRKSHETKGKPDISGYHRKLGLGVFVEIKTGPDKLSPEQIWYLQSARKAGCIAIEARNFEQFVLEYERQILAIYSAK